MTVGEKIKQFRIRQNISQTKLAKESGISRISIGYYERNERLPGSEQIQKIADALNIKPVQLMAEYTDSKFSQAVKEAKRFEIFSRFLEAMDYVVHVEKIGQSESGYYKEHKEGDTIVERYFIPDEEYFEIQLIKDGKTVIFQPEEFDRFRNEVIKNIDYLVWQQDKK